MKERGILFNGDMVRAILSGKKTQTRRTVKEQYASEKQELRYCDDGLFHWWLKGADTHQPGTVKCPFGSVGDRLWVRETWGVVSHAFDEDGLMCKWVPDRPNTKINEMPFGCGYYSGHVIYRADGQFTWCGDDDGGGDDKSAWKPSLHMPRAASRILLEITAVRVERLNDISNTDSLAEGIGHLYGYDEANGEPRDGSRRFAELWQSVYGEESWQANPWVWVVEFKVIQ